jgi:NhaP-type Na+/H+ or K+/H+ antiporter
LRSIHTIQSIAKDTMNDGILITAWPIIIGLVFIFMALATSILKRLPLTTSLVYLAVGFVTGPAVLALSHFNPVENSRLLEHITEVAVIISLFTAGLKLRTPLFDRRWHLPARLASVSMIITVGLVALVGVVGLGLPLGAAVLLGAILAPTDPVLASDVQVADPWDYDKVRFGLTGEAGLNDGTAFPFVMLGLGLLGLHEIGPFWMGWLAIDVVWATAVGLGTGAILGNMVGRLVLYLRREHKEAVGLDDFLALGLIALSYGVALLLHSYGFLAVFAAGLALRRVEMQHTGERPPEEVKALAHVGEEEEVSEAATHPEKAPAYMAQAVLGFNEQLERIGEVGVVILVGSMLSLGYIRFEAIWFVPVLFLLIRPLSVLIGLLGSHSSGLQRRLMSWFGIRGIGSIYYLMFAIERGLPGELAEQVTGLTLTVVASSIIVHGISVTPLMKLYERRVERRKRASPQRT